jgi:hypothetical protein
MINPKFTTYLNKRSSIIAVVSVGLLIGLPIVVAINSQQQNLQSNAAGAATIEPENGTIAGNVTVVNDVNTSGGKYVRFGTVINVKDYGATGNGSNDDSTAVQNAANAASGKTLYFPQGTYIVKNIKVFDNTRVAGAGQSMTTLKLLPLATNDNSPIINVMGNNVVVDNIKLDGNRAAQPQDYYSDSYNQSGTVGYNQGSTGHGRGYRAAIRAERFSGLTVTNNEIVGTFGAGVATLFESAVTLDNNYAHDMNFEMAYIYGGGTNVMIKNNRMANIASGDIDTNANAIVLSRIDTATISNNTLDTTERDFFKCEVCRNIMVDHNTMNRNTVDGFPAIAFQFPLTGSSDINTSNTYNVTVDSNTISNFSFGVQLNAGSTPVPARNVTIINNKISSISSSGILMDGTGADMLNIKNNTVSSVGRFFIYINGTGTNLTIAGNTKDGQPVPDGVYPTFSRQTY